MEEISDANSIHTTGNNREVCDIRVLIEEWEKHDLANEVLTPFRYLQDEVHELLKRNEMTDIVIDVEGIEVHDGS